MKRCLLFVIALALTGCAAMAEQERQRKAEADKAWCADLGITEGHPKYYDCRITAAQIREERRNAIASSNMGAYGLMLMNQSQQQPGRTTCSQMGNFLNCSHY